MQDEDKSREQRITELCKRVAELESDQAERKLAEEALRQSEDRYRRLAESIPGMVFTFVLHKDASFSIPYINERIMQYAGISPEAAMAEPSLLFAPIHPDDQEWFQKAIFDSARTLHPFSFDHRLIDVDGRLRWFRVESMPQRLSNGDTLWNGVSIDITEQKRTEEELRQYRQIVSYTPDGISLVDKDYRYRIVNDAYEAYSGMKRKQFIGLSVADYLGKEVFYGHVKSNLDRCLRGETVKFQAWFEYPTNGRRFVDITYFPYIDANNEIDGVVASTRDITDIKLAEEALRESEERLDLVLKGSRLAFWDWNLETNEVKRNERWAEMLGYKLQDIEFTVKQWLDFIHPDDRSMANRSIQDHLESRTPMHKVEYRMLTKDGQFRWILDQAQIVKRDSHGRPARMSGTHTDITERRQTEEALRENEENLRYIIKYDPNAIAVYDSNLRYLAVSDRYLRDYNVTEKDVIGKHHYEVFPEIPQRWKDVHRRVLAGAIERSDDDCFERPDGSITYNRWECRPWYRANGEIGGMITYTEVTTERKLAEKALRESEAYIRAVMDHLPIGVAVNSVDSAVEFSYMNDNFTKFYRTSREAITEPDSFWDAVYEDPAFREEIKKRVWDDCASGDPKRMHWEDVPITRNGQETSFISASNTPVPGNKLMISTVWDVTARKRAEEEKKKLQAQLQQAQKMESVGRLAGGVAHDYNNMLGVIIGYTELALDAVDPAAPLHADLEEILKAANRSTAITRQLLAFARKQTISPVLLDLNQTVEGMLKMLRRLIGEDIDLAWLPKAGLWPVKMDPAQIDQILANLCVNARDAIAGVGKVTIETGRVTFDDAYCADHPGFTPGEFVLLAVSDGGCGMEKDTLDSIFEPFFTTKDVDKGTGLGLATVYGIVKQNHGFINVYSEKGHGTTFKIYLPRSDVQIREEARTQEAKKILKGTETILLVEDEESNLALGKTLLERHGYQVLAARNPAEALSMAENHAGPIHLLLTDVVMPGMNGKDLRDKLDTIKTGFKCIFMSGYTANVIVHHGVLDEGIHFLQKPFSVKTLAEKVREVLDG
jgi:PAS domain S-box-containing protein